MFYSGIAIHRLTRRSHNGHEERPSRPRRRRWAKALEEIILKTIFIQLLLLLTFSSIYASEIPKNAWIDSIKGLNQRSSPDIKSEVIQLIPYHAKVEILEFSLNNKFTIDGMEDYWIKAKYQGKTGWLFSGYLIYDEPLSEKLYEQLLNETLANLKSKNNIIKNHFTIKLDKVQRLRIELKIKPERYIKYYINIIRFNNKYFSETEWYEGASCETNYIFLYKDYNDYIINNKNILKSFNSLQWPSIAKNINKVNIGNITYVAQDIYFMPADQYFKSLIYFKNNYIIICNLDIDYNIWISNNDTMYIRSDWFYKYNINNFKLKNDGLKYYKIAEQLLLNTIKVTEYY
jgi:hypothetical protein